MEGAGCLTARASCWPPRRLSAGALLTPQGDHLPHAYDQNDQVGPKAAEDQPSCRGINVPVRGQEQRIRPYACIHRGCRCDHPAGPKKWLLALYLGGYAPHAGRTQGRRPDLHRSATWELRPLRALRQPQPFRHYQLGKSQPWSAGYLRTCCPAAAPAICPRVTVSRRRDSPCRARSGHDVSNVLPGEHGCPEVRLGWARSR